jgi:cytochrome c oxidase subunit II
VRRGSLVQLLLFAILAGAAGVILAIVPPWLPPSASREAGRIHFVFWFVTGICIFIFAIVAAVLAYAVLKFRRAPDDDSDGPPIHGHTGLEIVWTAIPTALVTSIAIVSAIVLAKNDAAGANPLHIDVVAQQFAWTYYYPSFGNKKSSVLYLPKDRSIVLRMTSKDVAHSFWVPEFSQKQDLLPGIHPTLHITPDRIGTYPVICTELCGLGHALMRSQAKVVTPAAFLKWARSGGGQQAAAGGSAAAPPGGAQAGGAQAGLALFNQQGCNACHTLAAAKSSGTTGPDLDKLPTYARTADQPLGAFVRQSIEHPNAYVEKGYPKGVMPDFGLTLSSAQINALVSFLITSVNKG